MHALAQRISLLDGWRRHLAATLAGVLLSFAQAPFHLFVVGFIAFPVLVWLLDGIVESSERVFDGWRQAAGIGWFFGLGYFVAGLWWISNALLVEAPEYAWMIPFAVIGLPAVLAVFYAIACATALIFWSDNITRVFGLAASFGVLEWARSVALTGFPWNSIGYSLMPHPIMMQSVVIFGLFGIGALAVLVFALPAALGAKQSRSGVLAVVLIGAILASHVGFGLWRMESGNDPSSDRTIRVRLVQPALDQASKVAQINPSQQFEDLLALSSLDGSGETPELVVWPETSVPFLLTREPRALSAIGAKLGDGQSLLAGVVREEINPASGAGEPTYFNSIMQIDDRGIIQDAADKVHLVPFGEYLPMADLLQRIGLTAIAAADRGYSAASSRRLLFVNDISVVPLICYEAVFPALAAEGDLLLNVTNDAWYGPTPGPFQHMHQARLRSVEAGRPMVRVANNGISGVFDPFGRAVAWLGYDERGAVDVEVRMQTAPTEYALPAKYNFGLILTLFIAISLFGRFRSKNEP
ncbi:MAG: apolipoprotein N-acyltransferase [Pseudomonadota bacterium]